DAWNAQAPGAVGVIAMLDSRTYAESLTADHKIVIPPGSRLVIVAADWPAADVPGGLPPQHRINARLSPAGRRRLLLGRLSVVGMSDESGAGELILDGLVIEGVLTVLVGSLSALRINHCTLTHGTPAPGVGGIAVNASGVDPEKRNALLKL